MGLSTYTIRRKLILLSLYNNPSENKYYKEKKNLIGGHDTPTSLIPTKLDFLIFSSTSFKYKFPMYMYEKLM